MGNKQPALLSTNPQYVQTASNQVRTTYHSHENTHDLLRIFRLFLKQPYHYIHSIQLEIMKQGCCDKTVLKITSPVYPFRLQNLLMAKRASRNPFTERQIWYIAKTIIYVMSFLESQGILLGVFSPHMFYLDKGRFLIVEILHLLPQNQHNKNINPLNYYSPEKLKTISKQNHKVVPQQNNTNKSHINLFKSEVFSFGLMILEIATCPSPKTKFHKSNLSEIIWKQIFTKLQVIKHRYSQNLNQLIRMCLRQDTRIRPNWYYLKTWLTKNEAYIDVAPCVFWSS